jgi:glyoxylate reductase
MKVFVTRKLLSPYKDILQEIGTPEIWEGADPPPREVLLEKVADIDGLLCLLTENINSEILERGKKLVVVSTMSVGFEHIDIVEATKRGIYVCNTPGVLTQAVADHSFALLLGVARRLTEADRFVRTKQWTMPWSPTMLLGVGVHGKTLGIIGMGRIGRAVAMRAQGFDMKVVYHDVRRDYDMEENMQAQFLEFDEVLTTADVISVHVPSTHDTYHLFGKREFRLMKPSAIFINTARGAVVDEQALVQALRERWIHGAGIDVWEKEPTNIDNPLLELENTVVCPHTASATIESRTKMAELAARNLVCVLKGQMPLSLVNPDVLNIRSLSQAKRI